MPDVRSNTIRPCARASVFLLFSLLLVAGQAGEARATSLLRQFGLHLDDQIVEAGDPVPGFVDLTGFDLALGVGVVELDYGSSPGAHVVLAFFDHDIDAATNTFFNESGGAVGSPAAGQSWEVDEPGFVLGDLRDNFEAGTLDGAVGASVFGTTSFPDDVALAMGWQFELAAGEGASVLFSIGTSQPTGFHLFHTDPDSGETLYLTSTLIRVPEPGSGLLLGGALLLGSALGRPRRRADTRERS